MLYNVVVIDKCCCWQVLWIIPNEAVRWFSIVVALCLSGSILVLTFWPAVRDDQPRVAIAIMTAIVALHILLAFGCKVNIPGKKHTWAVFIRAQCSKTFLNVVHHGKPKWVFLIGQVQTAFFFLFVPSEHDTSLTELGCSWSCNTMSWFNNHRLDWPSLHNLTWLHQWFHLQMGPTQWLN